MQALIARKEPIIMGIINVTPDSFSDGGQFYDPARAVVQGMALHAQGADILDIGGESTRPFAQSVPLSEEIRRVVPVIRALKARMGGDCPVLSIDTSHPETMAAALEAGADMINDVRALQEEGALALAAQAGVPVCLMHMQGKPRTMQENPIYNNIIEDVLCFLRDRAECARAAGVAEDRIFLDPGIGFGKTSAHNIKILKDISAFTALGYPLVLGASRKRIIGDVCGVDVPQERMAGSVAAALWGLAHGVRIFRVHDVAQTRQAFLLWQAVAQAG